MVLHLTMTIDPRRTTPALQAALIVSLQLHNFHELFHMIDAGLEHFAFGFIQVDLDDFFHALGAQDEPERRRRIRRCRILFRSKRHRAGFAFCRG